MDKNRVVEVVNLPMAFNKRRDVSEVDQLGYVDIHKAWANGSIEGDSKVDEASYNNCEDPKGLMPQARDVFDLAHQRQTVADYKPPTKEVVE